MNRVGPLMRLARTVVLLGGVGWWTVSATQGPPALTALEQARVENVNLIEELRKALLEADACRGQLAPLRAQALADQARDRLDTLRADIERDRPGFTWNPTTGAFTAKPED